ncbi:MAG TPA: hypothetical protein VH598_06565 [Verrucomicrobiae bacterium]|nr:hypothetical protein [Verrucomicrobiae bacterium]
MPTEPEREIEKQLRAFAKERREQAGAPLEMHPATRRLLQAEAARLKGKSAGPSAVWSWLPVLWPRLAFGASIAAALMLACWLMLPVSSRPKPESKLAENLQRSATREAEINQPAPAATPRLLAETPAPVKSEVELLKAPVTNFALAYDDRRRAIGGLAGGEASRSKDLADKKSKVDLLQESLETAKAALAPTPNPAPARDDLAKNPDKNSIAQTTSLPAVAASALNDRTDGFSTLAANTPPPAASGPESVNEAFRRRYGRFLSNSAVTAGSAVTNAQEEKLALQERAGKLSLAQAAVPGQQTFAYYGLNPGANGATQQFVAKADSVSAGRRFLPPPGPNPVLSSFRVEQNGNEIRVIDGDNSIYTGQLQLAAAPAVAPVLAGPEARSAEKQTQLGVNAKNIARVADAETGPAPGYFFRVSGTNRSINQSVVFSGRFLAGTNGNQRLPVGATTGFKAGTNAPPVTSAGYMSNLQIEGSAVVGGTNQFQIIATPGGP